MPNNPVLYIIAGPNGVGKTNSFYTDFPINCPFINADDISRQLKEKTSTQINIQEIANREAIAQMNIFLSKRETFGFETNLADIDTWNFIENVKLLGYSIHLNFYCVDNVDICIQRVKQRVLEGGHDVREDIIKHRFEAALKLLKLKINIPDILILTDNSSIAKICAIIKEGVQKRLITDNVPVWVQNILTPIQTESKIKPDETIEEIRTRYKFGK